MKEYRRWLSALVIGIVGTTVATAQPATSEQIEKAREMVWRLQEEAAPATPAEPAPPESPAPNTPPTPAAPLAPPAPSPADTAQPSPSPELLAALAEQTPPAATPVNPEPQCMSQENEARARELLAQSYTVEPPRASPAAGSSQSAAPSVWKQAFLNYRGRDMFSVGIMVNMGRPSDVVPASAPAPGCPAASPEADLQSSTKPPSAPAPATQEVSPRPATTSPPAQEQKVTERSDQAPSELPESQ